ncbi:MAG: electron transport complex subunit RsxG [Pseudomonadales bacterium]
MDTPEPGTEATPAAQDAAKGKAAVTGTSKTLLKSIGANGVLLGVFALACTALIAATFLGTKDNIDEQQRKARLRALYEVVPVTRHDNDLLADNMALFDEALGHRKEQRLFLASRENRPVALIYPATARDGYSGDIRYIVGINLADSSVAGVRVLQHRETPGLGDGIELRKSRWITSFDGKRLGKPPIARWTVKKNGGDFDAFTGATITPRALVKSVAGVLQYHEQYGAQLAATLLQQKRDQVSKQADTESSQPAGK